MYVIFILDGPSRLTVETEEKSRDRSGERSVERSGDRSGDRSGERSPPILVPSDPFDWSHNDIESWLSWAERKLHTGQIDPKLLPDSGRKLCKLSR